MDFKCILICLSVSLFFVQTVRSFNLEARNKIDCLNGGLHCSTYSSCKLNKTSNSLMCFCVAGYTGPTCHDDRNECEIGSAPCTKRGVCHNSIGSFRCDCLPGWQGSHCQHSDGSGVPTCVKGYVGQNCTEDFDECTEWKPCENGGTCHNTVGNFSCLCPSNWIGRICNEDVNECNQNTSLCNNSRVCVNIPGSYKCECPYPYTGPACDEITCENGGTSHNTRGNLSCLCNTGWEGRTCNQDINECKLTTGLCHNGGSCVNVRGSYTCDCPYPYTGPACNNIATTTTLITTNTTPLPSTRPTPKLSNLKSSTTAGSVSIPTGALALKPNETTSVTHSARNPSTASIMPGASSKIFSGQTTNSHSTYNSTMLPNNLSVAQTTGSGQTPGPVGTQGPKPQKQSNSHAEESGGDTNAGAIAGPIVGVLVVAGAAGAGFFVYKKYARKPNTVDTGREKSPVTDDSNKNTKPKPEAQQTDQNTVEVSADNNIPNGIETVP